MTQRKKDLDLIKEYIGSIKKINYKLVDNENEINDLSFDDPDYDLKLHNLMSIRSDLKYFIYNLEYSLYWMQTGYASDGKQI